MVWGETAGELERCMDHLGVCGIIETDRSVKKILLWYLKSLRFFTAEFSTIFIFKKL